MSQKQFGMVKDTTSTFVFCLFGCLLMATVGCKQKKNDPKACDRSVTEVPSDFFYSGLSAGGAVKTSTCSTLAVGANLDGQPVILKYNDKNEPDATFNQQSGYQPFVAEFPNYRFRFDRVVVLPDGYLAMGSYTNPDRSSEVFAFKLSESGLLDPDFGPRHDGVIRGDLSSGLYVKSVNAPSLSPQGLSFVVNYISPSGVEFNRLIAVPLSGRVELTKRAFAVPNACATVNTTALKNDVTYNLSQNSCANLIWSAQGPGLNEVLNIQMDGSVYQTTLFGQFAMHYEDLTPVVVSNSLLGQLQTEYMAFTTGQNHICGELVDPSRRYLVLSLKTPDQPDFLRNCRYL